MSEQNEGVAGPSPEDDKSDFSEIVDGIKSKEQPEQAGSTSGQRDFISMLNEALTGGADIDIEVVPVGGAVGGMIPIPAGLMSGLLSNLMDDRDPVHEAVSTILHAQVCPNCREHFITALNEGFTEVDKAIAEGDVPDDLKGGRKPLGIAI